MTTTKAQQKAVNKYVSKNYDRINITLPKFDDACNKEYFTKIAKEHYGLPSLNQYIVESMKFCSTNKQFEEYISNKYYVINEGAENEN